MAKNEVLYIIPDGVETIAGNAFYMSDLISIYIPQSVNEINSYSLYAYSLESIYYEGNGEEWGNIDFGYDVVSQDVDVYYNYKLQSSAKIECAKEGNTLYITTQHIPFGSRIVTVSYKNNIAYSNVIKYNGAEELSVTLEDGCENVKIFVWDSLFSMKPLAEVQTID